MAGEVIGTVSDRAHAELMATALRARGIAAAVVPEEGNEELRAGERLWAVVVPEAEAERAIAILDGNLGRAIVRGEDGELRYRDS